MPVPGQPGKSELDGGPSVRLAYWAQLANRPGLGKREQPPEVRLAHGPGAQGDNVLLGRNGVAALPDNRLPGLLVSYYYLPQFLENRHRYHYRDWVMDSGAFSAHNSGVEIKLQDYIDTCKRLMVEDPTLVEIYALDVIGDWKASLRNTEEMWRQGVPAIPCFHAEEPWDALLNMAKDYPKIALGGVALVRGGKKMAWASQCFARVWPKKVHGFAFCSEKALLSLPFHSVDATSWEIGPCKYGQWRAFGSQRVSVRGSKQNLRVEVEWYLDLERRARERWKKEMEKLEALCPSQPLGPAVRLALGAEGASKNSIRGTQQRAQALCSPNERLATVGGPIAEEGRAFDRGLAAPTIRLAESGQAGRRQAKENALRKLKED